MTGAAAAEPGGWRAALELGFARRGGRTVLVHRRHRGPLVVQSPFYPDDGACHVYLLHPPGGLVGGDRLELTVEAGHDSRVLLTTPSATKLYRSAGPRAHQSQRLRVAAGAVLEWLPQEAIAFDGARATLATELHLAADARFLGWEHWCLGRPAADERFERGDLVQSLRVHVDGQLALAEVQRLAGGSAALGAPWGLGGHPAFGSFLMRPGGEQALAAARALCAGFTHGPAGATLVDGLLVCRALAAGSAALGRLWRALWAALRPGLAGVPGTPPRIWAT